MGALTITSDEDESDSDGSDSSEDDEEEIAAGKKHAPTTIVAKKPQAPKPLKE